MGIRSGDCSIVGRPRFRRHEALHFFRLGIHRMGQGEFFQGRRLGEPIENVNEGAERDKAGIAVLFARRIVRYTAEHEMGRRGKREGEAKRAGGAMRAGAVKWKAR